MRKFLTKARKRLLFLILVLWGLVTFAGNISLLVNKKKIQEGIYKHFKNEMVVGPMFYVFPNYVMVNGFQIENPTSVLGPSELKLSRIGVRFSLTRLLINGAVRISDVKVFPSQINYYAFSQFVEDNFETIIELIKNSPGNDFKVDINEILFDFNREGTPEYIATELQLSIKNDEITGEGLFRADQYQFSEDGLGKPQRTGKGWPLWYKLNGWFSSDSLTIDQFIIKSENLYSKLWGNVDSGSLQLSGFMFLDSKRQNSYLSQNTISKYFQATSPDNDMPSIDFYVLDIDSLLRFKFPDIDVERLNFALNNYPVKIKGKISLEDSFEYDARVSVSHPYEPGNKTDLLDNLDAHLFGVWKNSVWLTDGQVNMRLKRDGNSWTPEGAQVSFNAFSFRYDQDKNPLMDLGGGQLKYWTGNDVAQEFAVVGLHSRMSEVGEIKSIEFNAPFYDGLVDGKIWIDLNHQPAKITSTIELTDVRSVVLEELLVNFAQFNGRMHTRMKFTNTPKPDLTGELTILNGQLTEFSFFNWVSDNFRLPALKAVDFERATAEFTVNERHSQVYDIGMETDDVHIKGYFDVDREKLVSSKLTVALSQEILKSSSKFRPILTMFADDGPFLDFNFQLSGNIKNMNFQWLPSDVKNKIQKRIPDFMERLIERNVDELLESEKAN